MKRTCKDQVIRNCLILSNIRVSNTTYTFEYINVDYDNDNKLYYTAYF